MIFAVKNGNFDIFDFTADQRAFFEHFLNTFFNGGDEVFGNVAADDGIFKNERSFLIGDTEMNFGELTCAAGLFFVAVHGFAVAADGFTVSDFGSGGIGFDFVRLFQTLDSDTEVL